MRKIMLLLMLTASLFTVSCSDDDSQNNNSNVPETGYHLKATVTNNSSTYLLFWYSNSTFDPNSQFPINAGQNIVYEFDDIPENFDFLKLGFASDDSSNHTNTTYKCELFNDGELIDSKSKTGECCWQYVYNP